MNSFLYKDLTINHTVKKGLKNSYINITDNAEVILKTPKVSDVFIQNLLTDREFWIRNKISEVLKNPPMQINLEDEVLLFGEIYSIDMPEVAKLRIKLEKIQLNSVEKSIKCYNSFYKEYSSDYIIPRVEYFSNLMNLKYNEIKFRKMKGRWGSCSSKRVLTFNTELIKTKKELIDYVVVHELAHLKHMNHSKVFHSLVDEYLPNSKFYRIELKKTKFSTF
ncbi:MAG: M48 family metallopeptidase [Sulfurimonas sp.]|nr:M48 family metallopeptidase [Sulfurimonas sp.]